MDQDRSLGLMEYLPIEIAELVTDGFISEGEAVAITESWSGEALKNHIEIHKEISRRSPWARDWVELAQRWPAKYVIHRRSIIEDLCRVREDLEKKVGEEFVRARNGFLDLIGRISQADRIFSEQQYGSLIPIPYFPQLPQAPPPPRVISIEIPEDRIGFCIKNIGSYMTSFVVLPELILNKEEKERVQKYFQELSYDRKKVIRYVTIEKIIHTDRGDFKEKEAREEFLLTGSGAFEILPHRFYSTKKIQTSFGNVSPYSVAKIAESGVGEEKEDTILTLIRRLDSWLSNLDLDNYYNRLIKMPPIKVGYNQSSWSFGGEYITLGLKYIDEDLRSGNFSFEFPITLLHELYHCLENFEGREVGEKAKTGIESIDEDDHEHLAEFLAVRTFSEKPRILNKLKKLIAFSKRDATAGKEIMFDIKTGKIQELN